MREWSCSCCSIRQMDCPFSRIFLRGIKRSQNFYNFFSGGGKKKRILKPLLRLRGCVYVQTQIFTAISGTESMQKKGPPRKKNGASSKRIPQIGRRTQHKGNLYFSHPYSLLSLFGHFQSRKKETAHFWNPLLPKGRGETIRTCSKSEQQFERRRLVFPEKKRLWLFVSRRATSKHPVFPAK